uniref:Potassium inwardly rectifying channel subfamily J member 16 n=2 Tax=Paramormyrops kingsleyae TaxID=1676925 RepID=A0A3B3SXR0_9TELE
MCIKRTFLGFLLTGTTERAVLDRMSFQKSEYTSVLQSDKHKGKRQRYMQRDGSCDLRFSHVPGEWSLYITDIFTTLVEIRWRVMLLTFTLSYILSWLFFGLIYWVIALIHGDVKDPSQEPCMYNVHSFTAAFLFSLETQTTIGYGFRGMAENCMVAIVVVTVHDVLSCLIDTFIIGIAVAKMASARKRAQTVGFSSCAVVNLRDNMMCLSWRVGDFRPNHMVEGTARAQIVQHAKHQTGRVTVSYQDLDIQYSDIILATPVTIIHQIKPASPLYSLSPQDLQNMNFELVVSFTYTSDSTGILHQTRTSYTPAEIRWGHRFQDMLRVKRKFYKVDYSLFHQITRTLVPEISAEEYDRKIEKLTDSSNHELQNNETQSVGAAVLNNQTTEATGVTATTESTANAGMVDQP